MIMMMFSEARQRLLGNGYQLVPVQGEPLWIVFWPPEKDGNRRTQALTEQEVINLAMTLPLPGHEKGTPQVDVERVGVVGRLVRVPMTTNSEGEPKVQIVLEIEGRNAVDSLPIDRIRDMLGQLILLQLNQVQLRFDWEWEQERRGA